MCRMIFWHINLSKQTSFFSKISESRRNNFQNGSPSDAHVDGLVGLLNAYRTSRIALQPFAPTEFADCIYYVST